MAFRVAVPAIFEATEKLAVVGEERALADKCAGIPGRIEYGGAAPPAEDVPAGVVDSFQVCALEQGYRETILARRRAGEGEERRRRQGASGTGALTVRRFMIMKVAGLAGTLVAALAGMFVLGASRLVPEIARADGEHLVARAGDGQAGFAVNAFLPEQITVAVGTTVRWDFPWWEPHTVTFGVPQVGAPPATASGSDYDGTGFHSSNLLFGPGESYAVRFAATGTFDVYCIIHPGMVGSVTVVEEPGMADTQESLDRRGAEDYDRELGLLEAQAKAWAARPIEREVLGDGTTRHTVYIAGETPKGDVQTFFPPFIEVALGDTVRWRSVTVTGHTVTFGPFPEGIPRAGNPAVDNRSVPGETYRGAGYWNSGMMGLDLPSGTNFEMQFGTTGSFYYYCIPHVDQGMTGAVRVTEDGAVPSTPIPAATPLPPATGGGLSEPAGGPAWLGVLAVVIGLMGAGGWWRWAVRQRGRVTGGR